MKKLLLVFTAVLSCFILSIPVFGTDIAPDTTKRLYDDANLLSETEESELEEYLAKAAEESGFKVAVVLTDDIGSDKSEDAVKEYADEYYESLYGADSDGILFLINNDTKYDWFSVSGEANEVFTRIRKASIFDYFLAYLQEGDYYNTIIRFADRVEYYTDKYREGKAELEAFNSELEAKKENKRLYDDADLLSEAEESHLEEYLADATEKSGLNVAVVLTDNIGSDKSDRAVIDYADLYYERLYGIDTNGILLLINNDTKYDWISTSGKAIKIFTDERIDKTFDYFYDYIIDGDYVSAVRGFCNRVEYYADKGIPSNQYDYSTDPLDRFFEFVFGGPFFFGIIGTVIFCCIVYNCIKSSFKTKKQPASSYLNRASLYFTRQTDTFLRAYTTRTRVSSSSSGGHHSSGRSSTHRSSGGGRHGGGGRRR